MPPSRHQSCLSLCQSSFAHSQDPERTSGPAWIKAPTDHECQGLQSYRWLDLTRQKWNCNRYALTPMKRLRPYLEPDNNTAERSMRPIALGRKNYLFMGSERGGKSAAIAYTLIETAKLSGVNLQAWLTDVLGRIADHKITRFDELLPWRYAQT